MRTTKYETNNKKLNYSINFKYVRKIIIIITKCQIFKNAIALEFSTNTHHTKINRTLKILLNKVSIGGISSSILKNITFKIPYKAEKRTSELSHNSTAKKKP